MHPHFRHFSSDGCPITKVACFSLPKAGDNTKLCTPVREPVEPLLKLLGEADGVHPSNVSVRIPEIKLLSDSPGPRRRFTGEIYCLPHPPPQGVPHGLEAVVEVSFELAGHEDVLEEAKDAIHVLRELPDQAKLPQGAGVEIEA